jgi:hypothetical protein
MFQNQCIGDRTELVRSLEDWTDEFLSYLSLYVWSPNQPPAHHLHKLVHNNTYFDEKLTQFLFSFKG